MNAIRSIYHFTLAYLGAIYYRFPSRKMLVIGVTGTKGKSSTAEMINAIFEEAGHTTALLNSIHIKTAGEIKPNTMRMSMPGRFFIQRFLYNALKSRCTVAIIEMTSEGARQYRHMGISLDALVFTNLAPEHLESHGSYQAYADAKFSLGRSLARSHKQFRVIVANADDTESARYLALPVEKSVPYSTLSDKSRESDDRGGHFMFNNTKITLHLPGEFSLQNALAAASVADAFGIGTPTIARALGKITRIPGRAERIDVGQDFDVLVDYAHTPESLKALYEAYRSDTKICVMGATGGGRDKWKRPVMGSIAGEYCDAVILTDEDSYDEDPLTIINEIAGGTKKKLEIIVDRRAAIARGLELASSLRPFRGSESLHDRDQKGVAVLITGKGTDPTIQGPHHTSIPWSDAVVAREELEKMMRSKGI